MSALEKAIATALETAGDNKAANKAYLEFIKANFIVPIQKDSTNSAEEEPQVLFLQEAKLVFLPVFTDMKYLSVWADEVSSQIDVLRLSGVDLLKGIGDDVTVCLDIGAPHYKEFNPAEIARMRSIVIKLFKN